MIAHYRNIHLTDEPSPTSLRGLCGEYEDAGGEDEREGEAGGDGVALEVEEERRENVGRLESDELKSFHLHISEMFMFSVMYNSTFLVNQVQCKGEDDEGA